MVCVCEPDVRSFRMKAMEPTVALTCHYQQQPLAGEPWQPRRSLWKLSQCVCLSVCAPPINEEIGSLQGSKSRERLVTKKRLLLMYHSL